MKKPTSTTSKKKPVMHVTIKDSHFEMGTVKHSQETTDAVEALAAAAQANAEAIEAIAHALRPAPPQTQPMIWLGAP